MASFLIVFVKHRHDKYSNTNTES
uniref:Uncharacterized protein n=1 Tax=Anguilla anguilla TaxID=7936 RepID=A0A0E9QZE4_ANGAN